MRKSTKDAGDKSKKERDGGLILIQTKSTTQTTHTLIKVPNNTYTHTKHNSLI